MHISETLIKTEELGGFLNTKVALTLSRLLSCTKQIKIHVEFTIKASNY